MKWLLESEFKFDQDESETQQIMTKEFKRHRMDMSYHVMLERSGKKKITE